MTLKPYNPPKSTWNRETSSCGQAIRLENQSPFCGRYSTIQDHPFTPDLQHLPELCQYSCWMSVFTWATGWFFPSTSKAWMLAASCQKPPSPDAHRHLPLCWAWLLSLASTGLNPRKVQMFLPCCHMFLPDPEEGPWDKVSFCLAQQHVFSTPEHTACIQQSEHKCLSQCVSTQKVWHELEHLF